MKSKLLPIILSLAYFVAGNASSVDPLAGKKDFKFPDGYKSQPITIKAVNPEDDLILETTMEITNDHRTIDLELRNHRTFITIKDQYPLGLSTGDSLSFRHSSKKGTETIFGKIERIGTGEYHVEYTAISGTNQFKKIIDTKTMSPGAKIVTEGVLLWSSPVPVYGQKIYNDLLAASFEGRTPDFPAKDLDNLLYHLEKNIGPLAEKKPNAGNIMYGLGRLCVYASRSRLGIDTETNTQNKKR